MCSRWLRRLLVVLLLASCSSAVAAPQGAGNVRQAWQLLDYIAVDYTKAVVNGKVVSQSEYAEMREFSVAARARIAILDDNPQRVALLEQSDALVQLVAQHAPS
ncbi:MAG: iron permease, partial [Xanthomonadaceae bacterium]|nr:iron permease [Xanthomonadaceae bacterium]